MKESFSGKLHILTTSRIVCITLLTLALMLFSLGCSSASTQETSDDSASVQSGAAEQTAANAQSESELITSITPNEGISYSLYFGLIDKDTGEQALSTAEYREAIAAILNEAGVGYTVYEASGAYSRDDGTVVENVTLVFAGVHSTEEAMEALIEKTQSELNLESVYCESYLRGYGISGGVVNTLE